MGTDWLTCSSRICLFFAMRTLRTPKHQHVVCARSKRRAFDHRSGLLWFALAKRTRDDCEFTGSRNDRFADPVAAVTRNGKKSEPSPLSLADVAKPCRGTNGNAKNQPKADGSGTAAARKFGPKPLATVDCKQAHKETAVRRCQTMLCRSLYIPIIPRAASDGSINTNDVQAQNGSQSPKLSRCRYRNMHKAKKRPS